MITVFLFAIWGFIEACSAVGWTIMKGNFVVLEAEVCGDGVLMVVVGGSETCGGGGAVEVEG